MEQQPPQPPEQPPPQPQPWGGQPWSHPQQQPAPPPAPRPWGAPPAPRQPWGYRPPQSPKERPPGAPPPWYRHPVGIMLIGAAVVTVLAVVLPVFTGGESDPAPTVTTGAFGFPGSTVPPAAPTTSGGQPPTVADQLHQAAQAELGGAGDVISVTAPPGGQVTVTWEINQAGSQGLTENNARFGVLRIMRAIQESQLTAGGDAPPVRLVGRYRLPGAATPTTVVRLRFAPSTVERTEFDERRYLEAFELADAANLHPSFQG